MSADALLPWGSCKTCHSERPASPCWKCGGEVNPVAAGWEWPGLNDIGRIRELAREVGYAVGVHGSMQRDQDLISVPWVADAVSPLALAQHIATGLGGEVVDYEKQDKPCGRWSCNIHTPEWTKLIDLSVMPPSHPPQPEAPGWRDIATAPRDGTGFLVNCPHVEDGVSMMMWDANLFMMVSLFDGKPWVSGLDRPTHWQPLPPPPSADAKRSEPDALPGDLRERVARLIDPSAFLFSRDELDAKVRHHPHDAAYALADAILSLIQSERGEP